MEKTVLQAEPRDVGRHQLREIREASLVPAIVYGAKKEAQVVAVDAKSLHRTLLAVGTGLISLQIGDQAVEHVLPREIQRDPVRRKYVHIDFQRVSMTERIRLHVAIEQTGTAPILEDPDMILVRRMDTVEIECLPGDIPPSLAADLSKLATLDDTLVAGDLAVPAKVKLVTDPTHVVFSVSVSRAAVEEEEEEEVAEVEPEEVEVMVKGKAAKEEEEIEE